MMENNEPTDYRCGFVSIVGRPNVGKSTLLNKILGQKIAITANKPQTTRNRVLGIRTTETAQTLFLDTPGIHKARGKLNQYMVDQALSACSGVDVVLLVTDATTSSKGDHFILQILAKNQIPVVLLINKIDCIDKTKLLPLIAQYNDAFNFAAIIPICAEDGSGVEDMLRHVEEMLPPGPMLYPEDAVTDLPERFIVAEMIREKVLRRTRQELPYGVAVEVESFTERERDGLISIQAVIYVGRDAHKRILVGKGGSMIRTLGIDARHEIERFLDTKVYLELFVKVKKNWMESDRALRELGYN
ncbi:MAG: GTPase Era [Desulfuromonadaceae bacterium]|nr:GTPase Era [Desulfuromonadaceae bacterium]